MPAPIPKSGQGEYSVTKPSSPTGVPKPTCPSSASRRCAKGDRGPGVVASPDEGVVVATDEGAFTSSVGGAVTTPGGGTAACASGERAQIRAQVAKTPAECAEQCTRLTPRGISGS